MKTFKYAYIALAFTVLFYASAIGQENKVLDNQNKEKDSSYFSISVGFINDAVFLGRKDSIRAPYLYPSLTYYNKSGFYATGSLSYLTKPEDSRIDLFLGTVGYEFSIKNFDGDISFTKYFFNNDSYNVISQVEADVTASFVYDFKILNLGVSPILFFNSNGESDFILSYEISHDFVSKNRKFQISLTAGMYLGSQNFYKEYYINNRSGSLGQGSGQGNSGNTQTTTTLISEESEKFSLMALEFSLPIWYVEKHITIGFFPTFSLPKAPATLVIGSDTYEEDLENTFYFMLGIGYSF